MLRVPADHEEFARSRARPHGQHVLPGDPVNNHIQKHARLRYQGKFYDALTQSRRAIARVNQQLRIECFSFFCPASQSQIVSDAIYFMCVNALGLYFRFMNEVVIRRSFLDRRKCVESTLRLNYEKDQEVGLNGRSCIIATRSPD